MNAVVWIAGAVGIAAMVDDLRRRHIANWIPAVALAGGLAANAWYGGWRGLGASAAGAAAGFAIFLIFWFLGGMGGGDIKLMAGFGALLGISRLLEAALWAALLGGIIAAAMIGWSSYRKWRSRGATTDVKFIPYAPAIAVGSWLALIPKG